MDVEVVSPGGDYLPAGFGEGSLWATEPSPCNDGGSNSPSSSGGAAFSSSAQMMCAMPNKMLLKRLDPRTGEEVAAIALEGFFANIPEVAVGAGSVWVASASEDSDLVIRVDPETNRVVDRIPLDSPLTSLAFGHGSVWVTSAGRGTLSRIDPQTGEVAAKIDVGGAAMDVAVDEGSGTVWVAAGVYIPEDNSGDSSRGGSEYNKLSRVDPATNRVVAEIPIAAREPEGGAQSVAVGKGAVWAQGVRGRLFKVDPATNEEKSPRETSATSPRTWRSTGAPCGSRPKSLSERGSTVSTPARRGSSPPNTGPIHPKEASEGCTESWSRAGDTCGSGAGIGWLGSRRETLAPAPSAVTLRPVPSRFPIDGPSVGGNFREPPRGELRRTLLTRSPVAEKSGTPEALVAENKSSRHSGE